MTLRWLALTLVLSGCASSPPPAPPHTDPARTAPAAPCGSTRAGETRIRPRLIVWLTIDQLRGDAFSRFEHLISPGGFGHLLSSGLYFDHAAYTHAITETAPGHATLFTGAAPRAHGVVANEWMTPDGRIVASVTDPQAPLVGPDLDPRERETDAGRSPRSLLLPTVGDSLVQQSGGHSRVVSVSLKDRGAILPAGRAGQAFWLGKNGFVTSSYYATEVPPFLQVHHERFPLGSYAAGAWSLSRPESTYVSSLERPPLGARATRFPHERAHGTPISAWLRATPAGDVAVIDLALRACQELRLGQDEFLDLLAISLSSTDYIGHAYGPESREAEDTFARLDELLARFFETMDRSVGDDRILYVLSSDHGISDSPEAQLAAGLPAGRVTQAELEAAVRSSLGAQFGSDRWLLGLALPGVYLDRVAIAKSGRDLKQVRELLALDLSRHPSIHRAYALGAPEDGSELGRHVADAVLEGRSGDVYLVTSPYFQISEPETAAAHGHPWRSDRHVPIVLRGPGVPAGTIRTPVDVRSLAGTVSDLVGVPAPAGAHATRLFWATEPAGRGN